MEAVGVAPSARDHGVGIGPARQANQDAFLRTPKLLDTMGEKVVLKLPVNHLGGKKQGDLPQGGKPPRRVR